MTGISTGQFRRTIEEYFEDRDMDIVCRKRRRGYSLYFADDNTPLARLRPTGEAHIVELDWWDGNHWQSVTEFGLALPLQEALDYVTEDPDDVFFEADEDDEYDVDIDPETRAVPAPTLWWASRLALLLGLKVTITGSFLGAICGGLVAGAPWGLLYGTGAAVVFCLLYSLVTGTIRNVVLNMTFSGLPSMIVAGASGTIGAAVCQALGGGLWPSLGGAIVAAACAFVLTAGSLPAWLVGLIAGLNLGIALADSLEIRQQFLGAAVIAVFAACTASLCRRLGNSINDTLRNPEMLGAELATDGSFWRPQAPRC
jgi:hypothetical protein